MAVVHYVDALGNYLGAFDGITPPPGSTAVPTAPADTREIWNFGLMVWEDTFVPKNYEIYTHLPIKNIDPATDPSFLDFEGEKQTRFYPQHTFNAGVLDFTIWYAFFDGVSYAEPVLKETFTETVDEFVVTTEFYYTDGTLGPVTKVDSRYKPDNPVLQTVKEESGAPVNVIKNVGSPSDPGDAAAKFYVDGLAGFANAYAYFQDVKAQNTPGGTFTAGAWRTRDLNTEVENLIVGCSLVANQITLDPGDYYIEWFATANNNNSSLNEHQSRIYDTTGAAVIGLSASGTVTKDLNDFSEGRAYFSLGVQSVLELQHQIASTVNVDGFGKASNFASEIYSSVSLWRLSPNV